MIKTPEPGGFVGQVLAKQRRAAAEFRPEFAALSGMLLDLARVMHRVHPGCLDQVTASRARRVQALEGGARPRFALELVTAQVGLELFQRATRSQ